MHDLYLRRLSRRGTGSSKFIPRQRARRKAWLSKTSTYNSGLYFFFPASQNPEVKTYAFRSQWTRLRKIVRRLSITISLGSPTLRVSPRSTIIPAKLGTYRITFFPQTPQAPLEFDKMMSVLEFTMISSFARSSIVLLSDQAS